MRPRFVLVATLSGAALSHAASGADGRLMSYGRHLAQECSGCHRVDGLDNGIPSIIGWDTERFVDTLPRINAPSIGRDVRNAVYLMLPMGRATCEGVAQGLGLSLRTMQRQLDEAGETFTDILNEVRRELALRYVENPQYAMLRVAELLGYSSASTFTRWFSIQFGEPPLAWRRRHAHPAGSEGVRR